MNENGSADSPNFHPWTVAALSAAAYLLATALHEHGGHALASVLVGKVPSELGAFYVNTDYTGLSDFSIRAIALAGPLVSLLTGFVAFAVLRWSPPVRGSAWYFTWLLGTIGFMVATGYLLFSGFTGLGDLGMTRDGVFFEFEPEFAWRLGLVVLGAGSYIATTLVSVRLFHRRFGGEGRARVTAARRLTLLSYLSGAAASVAIGFLNPHGVEIVLVSAAAASLGATTGLLWMMQFLPRQSSASPPGLTVARSWPWVIGGAAFVVAYGLVFGPTLRL